MANKSSAKKWTKKLKAIVVSVSLALAVALGGVVAIICTTTGNKHSLDNPAETTAAEKTVTYSEKIYEIYSPADWISMIEELNPLNEDGTPQNQSVNASGDEITATRAVLKANLTGDGESHWLDDEIDDKELGMQQGAFAVPASVAISLDLGSYTINRNQTEAEEGGSVFVNYGYLEINSSTGKGKITGGNSTGGSQPGGGIATNTGATTILNSGIITRNTAWYGGGVFVYAGGTFIMNGGTITENTTGRYGGGVYASASEEEGGVIIMNAGTVSDNSASNGGAFYVGNGSIPTATLEINGGTISGNKATSNGGAINASYSTLTIGSCLIDGNTAGAYGGGIYCSGGTLTIDGTTISNNTSSTHAGGVYFTNSAEFTMESGTISGNTATSSYAGGVYAGNGTFTMKSGEISNNTAGTYAGGIYVYTAALKIYRGATISGNKASTAGGGVYAASGSTISIGANGNGTVDISNNKASGNGGGLYIAKSCTIANVTVSGNTAGGYGGGLYTSAQITVNSNVKITDNYIASTTIASNACVTSSSAKFIYPDTTNNGSRIGVHSSSTSSVIVMEGAWTSNMMNTILTADSNQYALSMSNSSQVTLTASGTGATASTNAERWEYAVANSSSTNPIMVTLKESWTLTGVNKTDTSLFSTSAGSSKTPYLGSAGSSVNLTLHVARGANVILNTNGYTIFSASIVVSSGGTLTIIGGGTITTSASTSTSATNSSSYAISVNNANPYANSPTPTVTVGNVTLRNYNSTKTGSAISVGTNGATAKIDGATISGFYYGVTADKYSTISMISGTITNCYTGIYQINVDNNARMSGGTISNCTIGIEDSFVFTMSGGTISGCATGVKFSGSSSNSSGFTMSGGTISGSTNHAVEVTSGTFSMSSKAKISGNTNSSGNGAGVYVNGGTFSMSGGEISGNAAASGAGVYVSGTFTMSGGKICNNTATQTAANASNGYGGGVYICTNDKTTVNFFGGTISGNTAASHASSSTKYGGEGGGVWAGGSPTVCNFGDDTHTGTTISGNSARMGGGVYLSTGNSTSYYSGKICNNTAIHHGGGVYSAANYVTFGAGVEISDNTAGTHGGGIYDGGYTGNLTFGGKLLNNYADSNGGGIFVGAGYTHVLIVLGEIGENTAKGSGGGIYLYDGSLLNIRDGADIWGNRAQNGAGVYTDGGTNQTAYGKIEMSGGAVHDNITMGANACFGGGINTCCATTITGGEIYGNIARYGGGIFANGAATLTIGANNNGTYSGTAQIYGNIATDEGGRTGSYAVGGGGIYVNNSVTFYFYGGTVGHEDASLGNYSKGSGGGLYMGSGSSTLSPIVKVINNTAEANGGGIYAYKGLIGGEISGNTAVCGGGIYMSISGVGPTLQYATIKNNVAEGLGGGVFVGGIGLSINTAVITDNHLEDGCVNNLYLPNAVTINGNFYDSNMKIGVTVDQFTNGKVITSDVVSQNQEGLAAARRTLFYDDADEHILTGVNSNGRIILYNTYVEVTVTPEGMDPVKFTVDTGTTMTYSVNADRKIEFAYSDGNGVSCTTAIDSGAAAGYTPKLYLANGTMAVANGAASLTSVDGNRTFVIKNAANEDTAYKVYYILQPATGDYPTYANYAEARDDDAKIAELTGATGAKAKVVTDAGAAFADFDDKAGFTFDTIVNLAGEEIEQPTIAGDGSTIVIVRMKRKTITVTYDTHGGTLPTHEGFLGLTRTLRFGETIADPMLGADGQPLLDEDGQPIKLTQSGNEFLRWSLEEGGETAVVFDENFKAGGSDITIHAVWKVVPWTITYHYGYNATVHGTNYNFVAEERSDDDRTMVNKIEFTHQDELGDDIYDYFEITVAGGNLSSFKQIDTATYQESYANRLSSTIILKRPTAEGYTFAGWAVIGANGTVSTISSIRQNTRANYDLWATWTPAECKVTFNANGGKTTKANENFTNTQPYGDKLPIGDDVTREGYTFLGWLTESDYEKYENGLKDNQDDIDEYISSTIGALKVTRETLAILHGPITLVAVWDAEEFAVSYTGEHGSLKINGEAWGAADKYSYGDTITILVEPDNGYRVSSIVMETANGNTPILNGSEQTVRGNISIVVTFTERTYNIQYTYDGGSSKDNEAGYLKQYSARTAADTPLPMASTGANIAKAGYTQDGWHLVGSTTVFTNVGGMLQALTAAGSELRNVTLVANWAPKTVNVFLHYDRDNPQLSQWHIDGEAGRPVTVKVDNLSEVEGDYILVGWSATAGGSTIVVTVDTDENSPTFGEGTYIMKAEDYDGNDASQSINNLYAVWHLKGMQMLVMTSNTTDGATEVEYTGTAFEIQATPLYKYDWEDDSVELNFQWYKDGEPVGSVITRKGGETAGFDDRNAWQTAKLSITNVGDSGVYTCILTAKGTAGGAESSNFGEGEIEITVTPTVFSGHTFTDKTVEYDGVTVKYFVKYDGKDCTKLIELGNGQDIGVEYVVMYTAIGAEEAVQVKDGTMRNAGSYSITAKFTMPKNSNYQQIEDRTVTYEITQKKITAVTYKLYNDGKDVTKYNEYHDVLLGTFNGKEFTVVATANVVSGDDVKILLTDGAKTAAGSYEAILSGGLDGKDAGNYVVEIAMPSNASQDYTIEKASHDLSGVKFEGDEVDYNGKKHEIFVVYKNVEYKDGDKIEINGFELTVSYKIEVEYNLVTYNDSANVTKNGGVSAGTYKITAVLTDKEENADNFKAAEEMTATLTISQADFFDMYDKEALLGNFKAVPPRVMASNTYTKLFIDGKILADDGVTEVMNFNDTAKFSLTYVYEMLVGSSYTEIAKGDADYMTGDANYKGMNDAGVYHVTADISFKQDADMNNFKDIEDIVIEYTISSKAVKSITVNFKEDAEFWYGEEFDKSNIESIDVVYVDNDTRTFTDVNIIGTSLIYKGHTGEEALEEFDGVGNYNLRISFLNQSSNVTVSVAQKITEVSKWQYSSDDGETWKDITTEGIQYLAGGYTFRAVFECAHEDGEYYAPATLNSNSQNASDAAYTLTAGECDDDRFVLPTDDALTGEVKIVPNKTVSLDWYYSTDGGVTKTAIDDAEIVYTGEDLSGNIYVSYKIGDAAAVNYSWTVKEIKNAGDYTLTAVQPSGLTNYALQDLEIKITVKPDELDEETTYQWEYSTDGVNWTAFENQESLSLEYAGKEYKVRLFLTDSSEEVKVKATDAKDGNTVLNAGAYTLASDGNFVLPENGGLTVTKKKVTVVWSYGEGVQGFTYNGKDQTYNGSAKGVGDEKDDEIITLSGNVKKDANRTGETYTATAALAEGFKDNYELTNPEQTFSIAKLEIEVVWDKTEFTYIKDTAQVPVITKSNIVEGDEIEIEYTYKLNGVERTKETIIAANVGDNTYFVIPSFKGDAIANYSWNIEQSFKILQATPEMTVYYGEYETRNLAYQQTEGNDTHGLREVKLGATFTDGNVVEGSFKFTVNGEVVDGKNIDLSTIGSVQGLGYVFTPTDGVNYSEVKGDLSIQVISDSKKTGAGALYVSNIIPTYVVGSRVSLSGMKVYHTYRSFYVEGDEPYGNYEKLSSSDYNATIGTFNADGYLLTTDDLHGEEVQATINITVKSGTDSGTAAITLLAAVPTNFDIVNRNQVKTIWYVDEIFDWSDWNFKATFENFGDRNITGTSVQCDLGSKKFGLADVTAEGAEKTVTFTFAGKTTTIGIVIKAKERPILNEVNGGEPVKVEYKDGAAIEESQYKLITFTEDGNVKSAQDMGATVNYTIVYKGLDGTAAGITVYDLTLEGIYEITADVALRATTRYNDFTDRITYKVNVVRKLYSAVYEQPADDELKSVYNGSRKLIPTGTLTAIKNEFTGENISLTELAKAEKRVEVRDASGNVIAAEEIVNAGTYTVTVSIVYGGEVIMVCEPYTYTVNPASLTATVNLGNNNILFVGADVEARLRAGLTVRSGNTVMSEYNVTFRYVDLNGGGAQLDAPTVEGDYRVEATITVNGNYENEVLTVNFSIRHQSISSNNRGEGSINAGLKDDKFGIDKDVTIELNAVEDTSEIKVKNQQVLKAYEISVKRNDEDYTIPADEEKVFTLEVSEDLKDLEDLKVFFIDEKGNAVDVNAERKEIDGKDTFVFTAAHGSGSYVIAEKAPGAPAGLVAGVVIGAVAAAGMAVACGVVFKKKRR